MSSSLESHLENALQGSYRVTRELTDGGMARVFVAHDDALDRDVVIKALSAELAAGISLDRFEREIQIAAQLRHPRIVPVLTAGRSEDVLFYTMPYIEGASLRTRLKGGTRLSLSDAIGYAVDVADALAYAHARNIIHRDIKPGNILIDGNHAVVTDFGIARAIENASTSTSVTHTGITVGTPTYMSPEQATGERTIDGRSDIYSLACVLFEMLAGEPPFSGNAQAVLARHIYERAPSVAVVRPDLPTYVSEAITRAMSKTPADRFDSASDFANALRGRGPRRSSVVAMKSFGRSRYGTAAAAVAVIAAVATPILLSWRSENRASEIAALNPRTVAVLYLDAADQSEATGTLAHGITRDLIYSLSEVPGLTVISEAGIRRFGPDASADSVARSLRAGTVVSGTIEPNGDSLRVDVRLIDPSSLAQTGTVRVTTQRAQTLALRDSVVSEVAQQLRRLLGRRIELQERRAETHSAPAWELRHRAADLLDLAAVTPKQENAQELDAREIMADSLLGSATTLDPSWAEPLLARGWIRHRWSLRASTPSSRDSLMLDGIGFADRALAISPRDPAAMELRGVIRFLRWRLVRQRADSALADSAESDLRQATRSVVSSPRAWNALSALLQDRGDRAGAVSAARNALAADPFLRDVAPSLQRLIFAHLNEGRGDSARALCRTALRRFPAEPATQQCELNVLGWTGVGDTDLVRARAALANFEREPPLQLVNGIWPAGRYFVAAILARSGSRDSAEQMVLAIRRKVAGAPLASAAPLNEAYVWTLLKQNDSAIAVLRRAADAAPGLRADMIRSPWFAPLASDPRYRALTAPR